MAQWRKIVVSGSTAELNNISSSGDIVPVTSDGSSLGGATLQFSDLYLAEGAVINWDNGDMTIPQTNNLLDIDSGNTRVDRLEIDSAADYIDVDTDLKIIAAADIILDPGGGEVDIDGNLIPNTDSADDLGASGKAWNKLWVDDIDLNAQGSISIGGTGRIDLDADDDTSIRASADDVITFEAAGADQVAIADGTLTPSTDDDIALGTTALQFSDLFLAEGGVINWDNGDVTLTQTADQLALAGGYLTVAGSITGSHFSGSAASTGSFGYLNVYGDAVIAGNLTFGDADTDSVSFGADITSNILPDASDSYNLGSTEKRWNDLYLSGSISASGGPHHIISATTIDIDSEGALTLDGGSITIGGDADVATVIESTTLDINSSGAITIDGTGTVSIDGADDMNFTITSGTDGEDLTIAQLGANNSSILITAAGTGTDAVSIDATAGSMVIAPSLANGKTLTIGPSSAVQMVFTPHGTAANEKWSTINTAGTATNAIALTATAGGVDINAGTVLALDGTGGIDIGKTADAAIDIDSIAFDLDASGAITIDSTSTIGIGINDVDQNINIGTQGERTISIGTGAFADTVSIGNATGATALVLNSGTGDIVAISTDAVTVDAAGVLELNSSGGAIGVGNDAVGQKISVGGDIVTRTEVELNAILVDINAGTGGVTIDGGAASTFTTSGGDITIDSVAGSVNIDSGESATNSVRIVASHTDGGIDVDAGTNGINVDSTGAITIGGTNATGVTIGKADTTVTIPGDLDINGTMTTIDTVNLRVADRFVLVASGSVRNNALGDGGLIVNTTADGSGSALFYNDVGDRWALTGEGDTGETQQVAPAKQYVVSVSQSAAPPTGNPGDFGRDNASRRGIIYIQTSDDVATSTVDGDIWIWS